VQAGERACLRGVKWGLLYFPQHNNHAVVHRLLCGNILSLCVDSAKSNATANEAYFFCVRLDVIVEEFGTGRYRKKQHTQSPFPGLLYGFYDERFF